MNVTKSMARFDGCDTLVAGDDPVWVKIGGMTLMMTPTDKGVMVDAWREDGPEMAEPWTVEFDGTTVDVQ